MAEVKVWEDEIVIPTYELGPEDPNPPLFVGRRGLIHPGSRIVYPYPLQEDLRNRRADKAWRIFYLENACLLIGVLPQLGGRVLTVFDKIAGREALYRNSVIKYARIGIRGAFIAGGIEWNFPNGHTVTTSSPVDCAGRQNPDGSASILLADIERVSRMRWRVALTLHPGQALFESEVRLYNRTALPNRFWFWANSAAPVGPGTQYRTTATRVSDLSTILQFPVNGGTDISWNRNHPEPQDMFSLNPRGDFGAWYDHDLDRGMVNVADRTESQGLKFFTWGTGDDGGIWEKRLTDSDGFYCEMQSGRFATQRIWGILPPYTEESWTESWYPVRKIGIPDFANREIAIALTPASGPGPLRLGVHATAPIKRARISLKGEQVTWEQKADLSPREPFARELPPEAGHGDLQVLVIDPAGREVARYLRRTQPELPIVVSPHIEPKKDPASPEDCWLAGVDHEKLGEPDPARQRYTETLKLDPGFSPARVALSVQDLRRGLVDPALKGLREVLERNPSEESARFHLGAALLSCGKREEAAAQLRVLMRSPVYRGGALYLLAGIRLGQENPAAALALLERRLRSDPPNLDRIALCACALRKLNRPADAQHLLEGVLAQDPLHLLARAEAWLLAKALGKPAAVKRAEEGLRDAARRGAQPWLELACEYAQFELYDEACHVLSLCTENDPLVHYHLGWYAERLGLGDSSEHYRRGAGADPAYVFPHRLESEPVLRRALEIFPEDGRAWYYLGNLLASRDRPQEAIACWEKAARTEGSFSVLRRNLGRAYWKVRHDPDRSVAEYREALRCAPGDYKLYLELDRILVHAGRERERGELLGSIPAGLMENDLIAERVAAWLADRMDFQGAADILERTYFYPWEIYKGVRILYVDCCIGRGIQLLEAGELEKAIESFRSVMTYPRNIGVGESRWKANAEAWYRIGVAQEKAEDGASARASFAASAEEPRPCPSALSYYRAMALRKLGKDQEAGHVLEELLAWADSRDETAAPAEGHYDAGLALKGQGRAEDARRRFAAALAADPGHRRSRWEQSGFGRGSSD